MSKNKQYQIIKRFREKYNLNITNLQFDKIMGIDMRQKCTDEIIYSIIKKQTNNKNVKNKKSQ